MYVVRNVFRTHPGKAKELVAKFKAAMPHMAKLGVGESRIMTDTAAGFWTVVLETQTPSLDTMFSSDAARMQSPEIQAAMKGYMDLVRGGHREIYKLE